MGKNIQKFDHFKNTHSIRESKYNEIEYKNTITTYLDEISEGIKEIDDTDKLEDIEHLLSHIIHKYILKD